MYLLDTNVVSELRRQKPHGAVVAWLNGVEDRELFISSVTIGEIQAGIEMTREQDLDKACRLDQWLDLVAGTYNVISMDAGIFRAWAKLMHKTSDALYEDAMIAATAKVNNLVVVTRNISDFRSFDVKLFNPFDGASY
ncbi:type II toxin-antitoxin system VapC family toxin [Allochromatium tepidum]|uniref:type II toxin-antitoxin system VapC family toxin n=1 Tax=Allochromatium tepidum TaxID=553982 RepID=UPI001BCB9DEB|nr:type II toxin-antitoxin system VapC family toxin [Allochromatium tepidum]